MNPAAASTEVPHTLHAQMTAFVQQFKAARRAVIPPAPYPAAKPAPSPAPQPRPCTLEDYMAALAGHDWYYDYTDDHGVWLAGRASAARIEGMGRQVDPNGAIRDAYLAARHGAEERA